MRPLIPPCAVPIEYESDRAGLFRWKAHTAIVLYAKGRARAGHGRWMVDKRELRTAPRFACSGTAKIDALGGLPGQPGKIRDLSLGGCLLELQKPKTFQHGSVIELTLQSRGTVFRVMGNVTERPDQTLIGVKFLKLSTRGQLELEELIADLEAGPVAKAG